MKTATHARSWHINNWGNPHRVHRVSIEYDKNNNSLCAIHFIRIIAKWHPLLQEANTNKKKQASRQRNHTYKQSMGINLHSLGRIRFGALHLPHFRNSSLTLWSHMFVQPILVFLTQDPIGCNHYWIWLPGSALRRWYWAGTYWDVILLPRFCHSLRGVNLEPVTTMGPNLSMGASRNECAHQFPADSVHVVSFEKLTVLLFRPDSDEDVI